MDAWFGIKYEAGALPVYPTKKLKNYTIFNNKNLQVSKINSNFVT